MLPIAVLPVAGLLLRLGQPDLLAFAPMAAAGDAIFSNLGLLFAIGVAVGLARENNGAAGLAAVVGFVVATKGAEVLVQVPADVLASATGDAAQAAAAWKARELAKLSVPLGIVSGLLGGILYNRYADIRLPSYLAFFAGRRFVPIVSGFAGLIVAAVFGYGFPVLEHGMDQVSQGVVSAGGIGLFAYGVLNRLLIITGLHHIINNVAWFIVGDYGGVTGDLKRFFAGDPSAGYFMSGFFPVMMFGLPAACLAMYRSALPARRREAGGLLLSMALTSFLTGVTEPIEFSFMFLAPVLYLVHALLTGTAMVVMWLVQCRLGFSFSAGLFDFVLNFKGAKHPLYLVPIGAAYFALYYVLFKWCIVRFDLKTPGRDVEELASDLAIAPAGEGSQAARFVAALGGAANLRSVDACTTRLRLAVADVVRIDEAALRRLGAAGMVRLSANDVQVVLGPVADQVAGEIRAEISAGVPAHHTPQPPSATLGRKPSAALLAALGGAANLKSCELAGGRILVGLVDATKLDRAALAALGVRAIAEPVPGSIHLLHADPASLVPAP
jgi:PTS system N-acetylglucosamine-specific IIC component